MQSVRGRLATSVLTFWAAVLSAQAQQVTQFPLPTPGSRPLSITSGPDGNVWFTATVLDNNSNLFSASIGRATPSGSIVEFPIPKEKAAGDITAGPDGNVWFTEPGIHSVGRMTPGGELTEFPLPPPKGYPWGIAKGPDGNLWIIDGYAIHRMTPTGAVTGTFVIPTSGTSAMNITSGPDGSLWFTEQGTGKVGRITTEGVITEFRLPAEDRLPHEIVAGPDGALWFAQSQGPGVARMTTAGVLTEFDEIRSISITSGPDGNLWFAGQEFGAGRMTPAGETLATIGLPTIPSDITAGPDGAIWVTLEPLNHIARITTGPCVPNATSLCFGSRFRVRASWFDDHDGSNGQASVVSTSPRSGYFWYFEPNNIEVVAKILDGCSVNDHVWFFAAGMTHVATEIEVLDVQTGLYRTYANTPGAPFAPIEDTSAFRVCP